MPRPFSRFSLHVFEILPLCVCVPNFKSTRFGDMLTRANYQIHCSAHKNDEKAISSFLQLFLFEKKDFCCFGYVTQSLLDSFVN